MISTSWHRMGPGGQEFIDRNVVTRWKATVFSIVSNCKSPTSISPWKNETAGRLTTAAPLWHSMFITLINPISSVQIKTEKPPWLCKPLVRAVLRTSCCIQPPRQPRNHTHWHTFTIPETRLYIRTSLTCCWQSFLQQRLSRFFLECLYMLIFALVTSPSYSMSCRRLGRRNVEHRQQWWRVERVFFHVSVSLIEIAFPALVRDCLEREICAQFINGRHLGYEMEGIWDMKWRAFRISCH